MSARTHAVESSTARPSQVTDRVVGRGESCGEASLGGPPPVSPAHPLHVPLVLHSLARRPARAILVSMKIQEDRIRTTAERVDRGRRWRLAAALIVIVLVSGGLGCADWGRGVMSYNRSSVSGANRSYRLSAYSITVRIPNSRVTACLTRVCWVGESTPSSRLITLDETVSRRCVRIVERTCSPVWVNSGSCRSSMTSLSSNSSGCRLVTNARTM